MCKTICYIEFLISFVLGELLSFKIGHFSHFQNLSPSVKLEDKLSFCLVVAIFDMCGINCFIGNLISVVVVDLLSSKLHQLWKDF